MKKFSMTSTKWEGEMLFIFNEKGNLEQAILPEVVSHDVMMWMAQHFPVTIEILEWIKKNSGGKITEVIEVEFTHFWNVYAKKEGSKDKAEQLWNGLAKTCNKRPITHEDKLTIMQVLPKYVARYRGEKKDFQPLATTFLHGRHWISVSEELNKDAKNQPYQNKLSELLLEMWAKKQT